MTGAAVAISFLSPDLRGDYQETPALPNKIAGFVVSRARICRFQPDREEAMGWVHHNLLWIAPFCCSRLLAGAESVTVHLYDNAGLSASMLARAEREATRIYRHSGVEVSWMQCAVSDGEQPSSSNCKTFVHGLTISLSILPPSMEGRIRESAGLGDRKQVSGIATGAHAYVFLQRVVEICGNGRYPQEIILGHLMAHELGHVLLGDNSHAAQGIMSARLTPSDLRLAMNGLLFFDSDESDRMRRWLAGNRLVAR